MSWWVVTGLVKPASGTLPREACEIAGPYPTDDDAFAAAPRIRGSFAVQADDRNQAWRMAFEGAGVPAPANLDEWS